MLRGSAPQSSAQTGELCVDEAGGGGHPGGWCMGQVAAVHTRWGEGCGQRNGTAPLQHYAGGPLHPDRSQPPLNEGLHLHAPDGVVPCPQMGRKALQLSKPHRNDSVQGALAVDSSPHAAHVTAKFTAPYAANQQITPVWRSAAVKRTRK